MFEHMFEASRIDGPDVVSSGSGTRMEHQREQEHQGCEGFTGSSFAVSRGNRWLRGAFPAISLCPPTGEPNN